MKVRAISTGFYGRLIRADEVFEVPNGAKATWFAPVKTVGAPTPSTPQDPQSQASQQPGEPLV
jgi:hypothetical protein